MAIINSIIASVDTNDANAAEENILENKTAYVNGAKITGIITNHKTSTTILNTDEYYIVQKGYHSGYDKVSTNSLKDQTLATARSYDILDKETAYANGRKITGTMTNQGTKTILLDIGDIYIIPEGYHSGFGKVTARPLASQIPGTAENSDILYDKIAWSNGNKLIGTMKNQDTVSKTLKTGENYTIPEGYHDGSSKITAEFSDDQINCTANSNDILNNKTACINGNRISGTMSNQGAVYQTLNADETYAIPEGYHNGSGKIKSNSLVNQTPGTATQNDILYDKTAYVNGAKLTGIITNQGTVSLTLDCGKSYTIPEGYHDGTGVITANVPDSQKDGTAITDDIIEGKIAFVNGNKITGTMKSNSTISKTLNSNESYTIPKGYHSESSKINVNSLLSQTSSTATPNDILIGETAWVNGNKITGTMVNNSTNTISLIAGESYTIPKGYHSDSGKVITEFSSDQMDNTATSNEILNGKIACINGVKTTGIMPNNDTIIKSLDSGETYTIPVGYHNGADKVTANSILGQMSATVESHEMLSGETAWANGNKITGSMTNHGAISQTLNADETYTIPAGYHNGSGVISVNVPFDQSGCTATSDDILEGKVAFVDCNRITGRIRLEPAKEDVTYWINTTLPRSAQWNSICYGNGKFVAVSGNNSNISAYSTDGINWVETTLPSSTNWRSICYGNGKYVTVASASENSNKAAYSTDGINWIASTLPSSVTWTSVCYGNGKFVAVAWDYHNIAAYSTDGITWIATTMPSSSSNWASVCYGNGKYATVDAWANVVAYSTDAVNWNSSTLPNALQYRKICYGDGKFVALDTASTGIIAYSVDCVNWNAISLPVNVCEAICYGNGMFVIVRRGLNEGETSNKALYSTDAINWNIITLPSSADWSSVCYGGGRFVAVPSNDSNNAVCTDILYRKVIN